MNWLVRKCQESDAFSWGIVVFGVIGSLLIGFAGR